MSNFLVRKCDLISRVLIAVCLHLLYVLCFLGVVCVDSEEKEVHLITTLDNTEDDLLTLEYIKVCETLRRKRSRVNAFHFSSPHGVW